MVFIMLPVIALTLSKAFDSQLHKATENELKAYAYSILAITEIENSTLLMPSDLLETKFNVIQSGVYAVITSPINSLDKSIKNNILWRSKSLAVSKLEQTLDKPAVGETTFSDFPVDQTSHFLLSYSVSFSSMLNGKENLFPITLHILKDKSSFFVSLNSFKQALWGWIITLMILFTLIQFLWLIWVLKPLKQLQRQIHDIEQGKRSKVDNNYPIELQSLTNQLNTLLDTEQNQRTRYRNALANLAHSLKNPLAIIQSQQDLNNSTREQVLVIDKVIEHQLKRAQSAGESSWYLGVSVENVVSRLLVTLNKIYYDKQCKLTISIAQGLIFKGDEADLLEILGNILDNAYKAMLSSVSIKATSKEVDGISSIVIDIEDDGIGLNAAEKEIILTRGTRADTYHNGHGIGLAIVRDLVASYQGELIILDSKVLGGALFRLKFSA